MSLIDKILDLDPNLFIRQKNGNWQVCCNAVVVLAEKDSEANARSTMMGMTTKDEAEALGRARPEVP